MPSSEGARKQAAFERNVIEQTIRLLFDTRRAENIAAIEEFFAPEIVFRCNGWRGYPRLYEFRGIEECRNAFHENTVQHEHIGSTVHEILVDEDQVAVRRTARLRNRGGGAAVDVDICNFFVFREGRIAEMEEFPDTDAILKLADSR